MAKNVTAPRKWQSSPDSPPTQLAYVTQAEIDMLVDANIHGSMDGKPNIGPKGIISLDGGGATTKAIKEAKKRVEKKPKDRKMVHPISTTTKEADAKQKAYQKELEKKHATKPSAADDKKIKYLQEKNKRAADRAIREKAGITVSQTEAFVDPSLFDITEGEGNTAVRAGLEALKGKLGGQTADVGYALYKDFWKNKKSGKEKRTLSEYTKELQAMYDRGETTVNLRRYMDDAHRAGLTGGGTSGGIEAYAKGTGQTLYQDMMDTIRTGKLGPQAQSLYKETFPKTYGFMRGKDILESSGGIGLAALKSMMGGADQEWLPYDRSREWYDELGTGPIDPYGKPIIMRRGNDPSIRFDHLTPYQKYKLQSQIQERGGFTGGDTYEDKVKFAKQMGIIPEGHFNDYFDYNIGEYRDESFKQPTKESELDQYLAGLPNFDPGTFAPEGILQGLSPEAVAEYNRIKRLRGMGADPVTGGAAMGIPESTQQITYDTRDTYPGDTDPEDTTPPGDQNQWATADAGKIGFYNPETGQYEYGTMPDYLPFAQVRDGGVIGLDGGGYLDDYRAADSLMFKDPQEEEEWEYNV